MRVASAAPKLASASPSWLPAPTMDATSFTFRASDLSLRRSSGTRLLRRQCRICVDVSSRRERHITSVSELMQRNLWTYAVSQASLIKHASSMYLINARMRLNRLGVLSETILEVFTWTDQMVDCQKVRSNSKRHLRHTAIKHVAGGRRSGE